MGHQGDQFIRDGEKKIRARLKQVEHLIFEPQHSSPLQSIRTGVQNIGNIASNYVTESVCHTQKTKPLYDSWTNELNDATFTYDFHGTDCDMRREKKEPNTVYKEVEESEVSKSMKSEILKLKDCISDLTSKNNRLNKEKYDLQQQVQILEERTAGDAVESHGKLIAQIGILKGTIVTLEGKILRLKEEKEAVTREKTQLQQKLEMELEASKKKATERENESMMKQDQIQKLKKDQSKYKDELQISERKAKQLEGLSNQRYKEIQDLTNRLSEEMGTKVSADESSLENVNIKDRPMNVATEYEFICSDQWLTAKTELDELLPDTEEECKMTFLCDAFSIGLEESEKLKRMMLDNVCKLLKKPGLDSAVDVDKTKGVDLPEKLLHQLMDVERRTVEESDLSILRENIHKKVEAKAKSTFSKPVMKCAGINTYLQAITVISWKMMLQRPPMSFRQDGIGKNWQGDLKQEVFWSSDDPEDPNCVVKYYVHPALHHGDAMMIKGRVCLCKK